MDSMPMHVRKSYRRSRLYAQYSRGKASDNGFTLVETLVAIMIVLGTLTATYAAVASSIQSSARARDTIAAFYLAQEAFEYVKSQRDTNSLQGRDWLDDLRGGNNCGGQGCFLTVYNEDGSPKEPSADAFESCTGNECPRPVTQHPDTGAYGHYDADATVWEKTPFRRHIEVTRASDEARVLVTVEWDKADGSTQSIELREQITNWR